MLLFIQLQEPSDVPEVKPCGANPGGTQGQTVGAFKVSTYRQCVTVGNVYAVTVNL